MLLNLDEEQDLGEAFLKQTVPLELLYKHQLIWNILVILTKQNLVCMRFGVMRTNVSRASVYSSSGVIVNPKSLRIVFDGMIHGRPPLALKHLISLSDVLMSCTLHIWLELSVTF